MYRIGVDLGGTNIAAGLVDDNYAIVYKKSVPTDAATRTSEEITAAIADLCRDICKDTGVDIRALDAIGIASPGIVNAEKGTVEYANNLSFRRFPLCDLLRQMTGVTRVYTENDANAAAMGEAVVGAAKGTRNSVMITLGTGVGGGIVLNGKVYTGFNGAAGELGHMVIEKDGVPCTCGRRGCFEQYGSASGLIRMTKEKMAECAAKGRDTRLGEFLGKSGEVNGRTAFEAMRAGDAAAKEVVDRYLSYLAAGIGNLINIFQPEVFSIGGGISNEGDNLLLPLVPLVRKESHGDGFVEPPKIVIAKLRNDAGIIGAAYLGSVS